MPATSDLASRIDAEFTSIEEKFKTIQADHLREYQERQKRVQRLGEVFDQLQNVWKPRLELLAEKFGDKVKVTPNLTPSRREAKFEFQSKLARVDLSFSASTNRDVNQIILTYDLRIIPVLMKFEGHSELALPIEGVDPDAVARWIDDRIVDFVKTYLALNENELYAREMMVEDPVAGVRFHKAAAGATLEWRGQTYYFIGEESRREFERQQGTGAK